MTEEQALWFRESKPEEELFDVLNDPHELNNLADDPAYEEKLEELRTACEGWIMEIKDTGMKPEDKLISEIWPEGSQPVTANPKASISGNIVTIACATDGASIGYKFIEPSEDPMEGGWTIYSEPFEILDGKDLFFVAHRIGFKRSELQKLSLN